MTDNEMGVGWWEIVLLAPLLALISPVILFSADPADCGLPPKAVLIFALGSLSWPTLLLLLFVSW